MSVILASVVALASAAAQQRAVTPEALDELLLRYAADGWSGAALVAKDGEALLLKGYGFADFQTDRRNDEGTLFEIASITKPFTATAVMLLVQENRVRLDDPLGVHVPGVPDHSRGITLRHLLSHTSGIPRTHAGGNGEDVVPAMLAYLKDGPATRPGAKWEYWNGGYALLAGVIERASGRPYTQFLEEELFARAGMVTTGFTGDRDLDPATAAIGIASEGADRSALEHPYGSYGYQYRGMGGIVTSARDLLAFDRALASGALLEDESLRELVTPVADDYALGWFVRRAFDGGVRHSHGGSVRGFVSDFRRLPELDACIAVLSNRDDARPWEIGDNLECLLVGRPLAHAPPAQEGLSPDEARACAGVYVGTAGRLVVRAAEGTLVAGVEGRELLAALGAGGELDWKADVAELEKRAVEIVEGLAHGNTSSLRTHMAKRIPGSWPDAMRRSIWAAHLERHGEFRGARPTASRARAELVEVLLALEHANGPTRALVAFGPAGLERLDLSASVPHFLVTGRLERVRERVFRIRLGEDSAKLEFDERSVPASSVRAAGLKLVRN